MWNVGAKLAASIPADYSVADVKRANQFGDLPKLFDEWLLDQDLRDISKAAYRRNAKAYFRWLEKTDRDLATLTRKDALDFKKYLHATFAAHTAANYFLAARKLYAWLEFVGVYPNIFRGVRCVDAKKGLRKDPLTLEQIEKLFASFNRSTLQGKRDYFLLRLLLQTGLRSIEVVRANLEDCRQHQTGETLLYVQGKGRDSKDDFVLLVPTVINALQDYLLARCHTENTDALVGSCSDGNRNERLTTRSIRRIVKARLRAIGLNSPRLSCHSFRHTAVTLSLVGGATIGEAAAMARHANLNTTSAFYDHSVKRVERAAEKVIDEVLKGKHGAQTGDAS